MVIETVLAGWPEESRELAPAVARLQAYRLVSYYLPAPGLSPRQFLRHAFGQERFFWREPAAGPGARAPLTLAGFGVAAELFAWGANRFAAIGEQAAALFAGAELLNGSQPLAEPRLFGGFAFRDDFVPDNTWSIHQPAHFVLPHYQLAQAGDESWLTINTLLPPEEEPADNLPQLRAALQARYELLIAGDGPAAPPARVTAVEYPLPFAAWAEQIGAAQALMGRSALKKVVLSRVCELRFDGRFHVDGALDFLQSQYASCYQFLFEPRPYHAFFGATPELLARVNGRALHTMALAGSIRRGQSDGEDQALAGELLHSAKDRYEHQLVVDSIRRRLAPVTARLEIPDQPAIYRLSNIQHLYTPIQAELLSPVGILPIVERLHPTPALGGSPRDLAMAFISQAEPVPRGWYAAPVGLIDPRLEGQFTVAIRSAVAQDRRVWLYAGAGIVADSDPDKEWDETALKFRPLLAASGAIEQ